MSNLLSCGGNVVEVKSNSWQTIASLIYPGADLESKGLEVKKAWITAQAGDTRKGLDLVLEDNVGNVVAGPSTSYGGSVIQLMALFPFRANVLRKSGPPQVLLLRARNRSYGENDSPSLVGQLALEVAPK